MFHAQPNQAVTQPNQAVSQPTNHPQKQQQQLNDQSKQMTTTTTTTTSSQSINQSQVLDGLFSALNTIDYKGSIQYCSTICMQAVWIPALCIPVAAVQYCIVCCIVL
jgi:hypothetical protein